MTRAISWNGLFRQVRCAEWRSERSLTNLQLASSLPSTSRNGAALTNAFLSQLWSDIKHPPFSYALCMLSFCMCLLTASSYLGRQFVYRQADGSNNVSYYLYTSLLCDMV